LPDAADIADQKYVSLVTFRKDGTPVPTPVWVARNGDALGCLTYSGLAKVKRIRANPAVTVAPCTLRGKVRGEAVPGKAEMTSAEETAAIRAQIDEKYGFLGRFITKRGMRRADPMVGIRITLD
jgi:PPOX class probable F420-dependent enzyme